MKVYVGKSTLHGRQLYVPKTVEKFLDLQKGDVILWYKDSDSDNIVLKKQNKTDNIFCY